MLRDALWLAVAAALTAVGCHADTISAGPMGAGGAGGAGGDVTCATPCDDGDPCTFDECVEGQCHRAVIEGEPPQNDTDPDPQPCFTQICQAGAVVKVPAPGNACQKQDGSGGVCNAEGSCGCPAAATSRRFVDPLLGSDDELHGTGAEGCAFKTLSYALQHAAIEIFVAPGSTLSSQTGERFPLELDGYHQVICQGSVTLVGDGNSSVVSISGDRATLSECSIDGAGAEFCVEMVGSGEPDQMDEVPGSFSNNDIGGCVNGLLAVELKHRLAHNHFHDNSSAGVLLVSTNGTSLYYNNFTDNGTDVVCDAAFGAWGTHNASESGVPSCTTCSPCLLNQ